MNKTFFIFCAFLITVSIIVSCEKERDETYPQKYVFTDIIYGEVNSYTNSGDKNEPDKIYSFLEDFKKPWFSGSGYVTGFTGSLLAIYNEQPTNIPFNFFDEIELISDSKAKITSNDTIINFDVIRKNGILYFQSLDTMGWRDITEPDNRPYYLKPFYFWNEKLKYSPINVDTVEHYGISGFWLELKYEPCIYAIERKDEIQISYTSYVERTMTPIYWSDDDGFYYDVNFGAVQNIQNGFNQDYLLSYKTDDSLRRDTIVYKTNTIIFKKVKHVKQYKKRN